MLIGNVGNAPELKRTPGGIPVVNFRMATSEIRKDRTGKVIETTDWHSVVAWRGLAEVIEKLVGKGSRIYVEGKLNTRNYDDKHGNRRRIVEVMAETMLLLDKKKDKSGISEADSEYDYEEFEDTGYDSDYSDRYEESKPEQETESPENEKKSGTGYLKIEDVPF